MLELTYWQDYCKTLHLYAADRSLEYKDHGQVPSLFGTHAISEAMIRWIQLKPFEFLELSRHYKGVHILSV